MMDEFRPDAVHIPVEGPIGLAARRHCLRRRWPFTTSYHTRAGLYFQDRFGVPSDLVLGHAALVPQCRQRLHGADRQPRAASCASKGFVNIRRWCRGVDTELFQPRAADGAARPAAAGVHLCRPGLGREEPRRFPASSTCPAPSSSSATGRSCRAIASATRAWCSPAGRQGEELSRYYSASDVFVFPSRFETFGLVLLEALACGLPGGRLPGARARST